MRLVVVDLVDHTRGTVKDHLGKERTVTFADVIPEAGKPARMRKSNIFAGQVGAVWPTGHLLGSVH
jgi:hypothetical protein